MLRGKIPSLKDKHVLQAEEQQVELRAKRNSLKKQVKKVVLSTKKEKKNESNKK